MGTSVRLGRHNPFLTATEDEKPKTNFGTKLWKLRIRKSVSPSSKPTFQNSSSYTTLPSRKRVKPSLQRQTDKTTKLQTIGSSTLETTSISNSGSLNESHLQSPCSESSLSSFGDHQEQERLLGQDLLDAIATSTRTSL